MEGGRVIETFDHVAMAESIGLDMDRLEKVSRVLAALTFNSEEVDRRYEAGQTRLARHGATESSLQLL